MTSPQRIALVCPYSCSIPGGVQGQVLGIAGALERLGREVLVVAPLDEGERPHSLSGGVAFAASGTSVRIPVNGSRAPVALGAMAARRASRNLREFAPEIVHLHEPFVPLLAPLVLARRRSAVLGTFHRAGAGAGYRMVSPLARIAYARLDDAVAVSAAARETLVAVVGQRGASIDIVENGVDVARFERAVTASARPRIVFVGRLEARKGAALLVEAFRMLPIDAELVVAGAGPEHDRLVSLARGDGRITFAGRLSDDEVAALLRSATILVAPALSGESFGVVLLEAMAAGAAVLAADIEGYRLAARGAARLFRAGDRDDLAAALANLLADPGALSRLIAAGRTRAAEASIDAVAHTYLERYQAILARDSVHPRRGTPRTAS